MSTETNADQDTEKRKSSGLKGFVLALTGGYTGIAGLYCLGASLIDHAKGLPQSDVSIPFIISVVACAISAASLQLSYYYTKLALTAHRDPAPADPQKNHQQKFRMGHPSKASFYPPKTFRASRIARAAQRHAAP